MPEHPILIAAVSGRALAASARRRGFLPLVVDCFGDEDTLAAACAHERVRFDHEGGLDPEELLQALDSLCGSRPASGIVYGTGFEHRPDLLDRIATRWRLLGNTPETVARLKDPACLAALCRDCGVPHPPIATECPAERTHWLVKRAGAAGGAHVRGPAGRPEHRGAIYYQREVEGIAHSALVLGNGRKAIVLGFSAQWAQPAAGRPFRYGGAARPAGLRDETAAAITQAVERLASAVPIVGLNSFDFLVDNGMAWLLEINPRPGATLDIFEPPGGSLFGLHVAACEGTLPGRAPHLSGGAAACIVYADRDVPCVPIMTWPAWAADRQRAGTSVRADDPFCTVHACAPSADEAARIVKQRAAAILAMLDARLHEGLSAH